MVWFDVAKTKIIGPFFFENENITAASYRNMPIQYALPRFSSLREDYIFMQHGASTHHAILVRNYLSR